MTEYQVPAGNLIGILFSLAVSWGVPTALAVYFYKKKRADIFPFFVGCASFFIFAMLLEQLMHMLVLRNLGSISQMLQDNLILYALYGGLAAGVFEETGRFLSMKYVMKKSLTHENALMYGAGHGGMEAVLILGMASFNNLISTIMINSGRLVSSLAEGSDVDAILTRLSPLWTLPAWQFFMGGIERIMAMVIHVALSVLVYHSVKEKQNRWLYPAAILLHAGINFSVIVVANHGSLVLAESITLLGTLLVCWIAKKASE
ncbi:MAG: YhfC family intramembrane metalloprotease [Brotaphodocola sp.]